MAARKKGDLVLYCGGLFPTEAHKPPSCPSVKPKMDLYCQGFPLVKQAALNFVLVSTAIDLEFIPYQA